MSGRRGIRALGLVLTSMLAMGCDPLRVDDGAPQLTSIGPVSSTGSDVLLRFSVDDAEGDPVEVLASWCREGQRCAGQTCEVVTALRGGPNPRWVTTAAPTSVLHTLRWRPGCEPSPPTADEWLVWCLAPTGGEALQSPAFRLSELGVREEAECAPAQ